MKKIYTLLCIAATMLAACTKENLVENDATPQDEEVKYIDVTFDAEFPVPAELQDNAKTMLNSDLSVLWSDGDQIAVNCNNGIGTGTTDLVTFTADINPKDHHKATFSGSIREGATKFFAVYPSANVVIGGAIGISTGNIYTVLPNLQTATVGSFTNGCALSYAYGSASEGIIQDKIEFYNLCAILEFTMPDYVVGAQTVNIRSNDGTIMSGGCVIGRNDFQLSSFGPSKDKKPTYDNVTVTAPNTASKFYAVIFPGNYSNGFTITVTTAGGQVYSRNVTKALKADANHIYNLGTLGVVLDKGKVDLAVNIEQNIKTGSIATFNIAAKDDFKAMVKSWDISLYNSDDKLVRKIEGNTTGSGTLETVGDFKLLAAGNYYAKVSYFMQTGSKREAFKIEGFTAPQFQVEGVVVNATTALNYEGSTLNGTDVELSFNTSAVDPDLAKHISWGEIKLVDANGADYRTATAAGKMTPAAGKPYLPNGEYTLTAYFTLPDLGCNEPTPLDPKTIEVNLTPTFGVELTSAKTSYNYYTAGNIDQANLCKNMGIYDLAANVTGISDAVATQMAGKFTYEWFLDSNSIGKTENDNAAVSGISQNTDNAVTVAFGNKNVKCKATFDGGNATSGNIAVDITGLPYNPNGASITNYQNDWTIGGEKNYDWDDKNGRLRLRGKEKNDTFSNATFKGFYVPADINTTISYRMDAYCSTRFVQGETITFTAAGTTVVNDTVKDATAKTVEYKSTKDITFSPSQKTMVLTAKGYSSGFGVCHSNFYRIGVTYK